MPDGETPGLVLVTEVAPYGRGDQHEMPAGVHHSLPSAVTAFAQLAELCGLTFAHCPSVRSLPESTLALTRVLVLLTIGDTPWSTDQRATIARRLRAGELGLLGLHCASDASADWPEYGPILGGRFNGHPVTSELPVAVLRRDHPATQHLPPVWHFTDELYLFREFAADNDVLLAIRNGRIAAYEQPANADAADTPVAWTRSYGTGRVFYSALGHFGAAWEDRQYLLHVLGGLHWVLDR